MNNYKKHIEYTHERKRTVMGGDFLIFRFYFKGVRIYYVVFHAKRTYHGIDNKCFYYWLLNSRGSTDYFKLVDGLVKPSELVEWAKEITKKIPCNINENI